MDFFRFITGDTMMTYCNNQGGISGTTNPSGTSGSAVSNSSPSPQIPCSGSATPPTASGGPPGGSSGSGTTDPEDDIWRGHSIAALRRRASELNAAIPSYLQLNYDAPHNASGSVY